MEQGVDVVDLGLASTDLMYFAAGTLDAPGAMFTASHNPAEYNGVKFCLSGARPVGDDTGLVEIKQIAQRGARRARRRCRQRRRDRSAHATCSTAFVDHVLSFVDTTSLRPMRVVADTANGMGGLVVPAVFERIPQLDARGDVRRARRHVPQPPRRPAAAGEPARPAGPRRDRRVRRRPGVRRRRRPRVRGRRGGQRAVAARRRRRSSHRRSCARIPVPRSSTT